jgi:hypothetical protein
MTNPVNHRNFAVLKLPRPVAIVISIAKAIVVALTGNKAFPTPQPSLAAINTAIGDLEAAEAVAQTRAKGAVAARNQKRAALEMLLEQLRGYVQNVVDADPANSATLIESAAMRVRKVTLRGKRVFAVTQGPVSGSVKIVTGAAGPRVSYEWQLSADGGKTWQPLSVTVAARTSATGLQPGVAYAFRYRVSSKSGATDWSQPITRIVL